LTDVVSEWDEESITGRAVAIVAHTLRVQSAASGVALQTLVQRTLVLPEGLLMYSLDLGIMAWLLLRSGQLVELGLLLLR